MPFDRKIEIYENYKQRLNLSLHAWNTIKYDTISFESEEEESISKKSLTSKSRAPKDKTTTREINLSGTLNRIFSNFYEDAKASISKQAKKKREHYTSILGESPDKESIIDILIEKDIVELEKNIPQQKDKDDKPIYFRINEQNFSYLTEPDKGCDENKYYTFKTKTESPNLSLYLKAIFEEYAKKYYCERERIFFGDIIKKIEIAKDKERLLRIKLRNGELYHVCPYAVLTDNMSVYNYLACYSKWSKDEKGENDKRKMLAVRISKIKNVEILESLGSLSDDEKIKIEDTVNERGVAYISSDNTSRFMIKLTDVGIKNYNEWLWQRPPYTEITGDGKNIYIFNCSERQVLVYFFKFGKEAEVIEPEGLREKFADGYRSAAKRYAVN